MRIHGPPSGQSVINNLLKAYKFRLYPNAEQETVLKRHFGACRFVWNHFLDIRNRRYAETGKGMTYNQTSSELKTLKHSGGYQWLNESNSQSLQQTLMHLDSAFQSFFRKNAEHPVFKKKEMDSLPLFPCPS